MNIIPYLGIPFEEKDCYSLVRYFYEKEFAIKLPDFGLSYDKKTGLDYDVKVDAFYNNFAKQWRKLADDEAPIKGDVVAMAFELRLPDLVTHFAIAVNEYQMLHTSRKTRSAIEPISRWKNTIKGIYRYEPNCNR